MLERRHNSNRKIMSRNNLHEKVVSNTRGEIFSVGKSNIERIVYCRDKAEEKLCSGLD